MQTKLLIDGKEIQLENVALGKGEASFTLNGKPYLFKATRLPDGSQLLEKQTAPGRWQRVHGSVSRAANNAYAVQLGALTAQVAEPGSTAAATMGPAPLSPPAPMPGVICELFVKPGDKVQTGDKLVMMEAMKLQTVLYAGGDGTVEAVNVKPDDMVTEGQELISLIPASPEGKG